MVYDWEGKRRRRVRSVARAAGIVVVVIAALATMSELTLIW